MNIVNIIEQRIKLQSTARAIEAFGVKFVNVKFFNSNDFKKLYNSWDDSKKKNFLITLGGKTNLNQTKTFIENKI